MELKYKVSRAGRKQMVAIISREARTRAVYTGLPECAFVIGNIKVTRDGRLLWDNRTEEGFIEMVKEALADEGFRPEQQEETAQECTNPGTQETDAAIGMPEVRDAALRESEAAETDLLENQGEDAAAIEGNSDAGGNHEEASDVGTVETDGAMESQEEGLHNPNGPYRPEENGQGTSGDPGTDGTSGNDDSLEEPEEGATDQETTGGSNAAEDGHGRLVISVPEGTLTEEALGKLEKIIASKQSLLKKALETDSLIIEHVDGKISFPWFKDPEGDPYTSAAYSHLISALCKMAKEAKRVVATEKETESEKYTFRCFLLRLGFVGPEYKHERAVLLKNLSGHSAFKTQAEADAFYEKLKAKRDAAKDGNAQPDGQGEEETTEA